MTSKQEDLSLKMAERRKFIVFEGIDGCGKGTQFKLFHNFLWDLSKFNHIVATREPYKSKEIREIMAEDKDAYSRPEECAGLFIKDRFMHAEEVIQPALEKGLVVLSDRYKYSTIAYQSTQGMPIKWLIHHHKGLPVPDLVYLIDVPVEVAAERMKAQKDGREKKFESNLDFSGKVRKNYLSFPALFPEEDIRVIDGVKPIEEVHQEIANIFQKKFSTA